MEKDLLFDHVHCKFINTFPPIPCSLLSMSILISLFFYFSLFISCFPCYTLLLPLIQPICAPCHKTRYSNTSICPLVLSETCQITLVPGESEHCYSFSKVFLPVKRRERERERERDRGRKKIKTTNQRKYNISPVLYEGMYIIFQFGKVQFDTLHIIWKENLWEDSKVN